MATPEFQSFLANVRFQQGRERWMREQRQRVRQQGQGQQVQEEQRAQGGGWQGWQEEQGSKEGQGCQPSSSHTEHDEHEGLEPLQRTSSMEELEASEEESRGLLADVARGTHGPPVTAVEATAAIAAPRGEGASGLGEKEPADNDENAPPPPGSGAGEESDEELRAAPGPGAEDQLPDEFVLMAHACFLAARVYERWELAPSKHTHRSRCTFELFLPSGARAKTYIHAGAGVSDSNTHPNLTTGECCRPWREAR